MTVYRLNALDETGARIHLIIISGGTITSIYGEVSPLLSTQYTHPAPAESPGGVEDYCNLCNAALKALNP